MVVQMGRIGMGRHSVVVGDEEITFGIILHAHKVAQCAEIIAQVKLSGRPDTAEYYIHIFFVTVCVFYKRKAKQPDISYFFSFCST